MLQKCTYYIEFTQISSWNVIYESLGVNWSISKTKGYHAPLILFRMCDKSWFFWNRKCLNWRVGFDSFMHIISLSSSFFPCLYFILLGRFIIYCHFLLLLRGKEVGGIKLVYRISRMISRGYHTHGICQVGKYATTYQMHNVNNTKKKKK